MFKTTRREIKRWLNYSQLACDPVEAGYGIQNSLAQKCSWVPTVWPGGPLSGLMTKRLTYGVEKIVALKNSEVIYWTFEGHLQGPIMCRLHGKERECRQKFDGPLGRIANCRPQMDPFRKWGQFLSLHLSSARKALAPTEFSWVNLFNTSCKTV